MLFPIKIDGIIESKGETVIDLIFDDKIKVNYKLPWLQRVKMFVFCRIASIIIKQEKEITRICWDIYCYRRRRQIYKEFNKDKNQ